MNSYRTKMAFVVLLLVFVSVPFHSASGEDEKATVDAYPEYTLGDNFEYNTTDDSNLTWLLREMWPLEDDPFHFPVENTTYESHGIVYKVVGQELIDIGNETFLTLKTRETTLLDASFFEIQNNETFSENFSLSTTRYCYIIMSSGAILKEEIIKDVLVDYTREGNFSKFGIRLEKTIVYSDYEDGYSFPLSAGKNWTDTSKAHVSRTIAELTVDNDGNLNVSYADEDYYYGIERNFVIYNTTSYSVEAVETVNVSAGEFRCLKVSRHVDGTNETEYHYMDVENGFLVKWELYENDTFIISKELSEYTFAGPDDDDSDDDDDSGFLPGMELAFVATAVAITVVVVSGRNGKSGKR